MMTRQEFESIAKNKKLRWCDSQTYFVFKSWRDSMGGEFLCDRYDNNSKFLNRCYMHMCNGFVRDEWTIIGEVVRQTVYLANNGEEAWL